jgi:hypothetical protein
MCERTKRAMLRFDRAETHAPEQAPVLSADPYRLLGESFAVSWKNHIDSTLSVEISDAAAKDSAAIY